MSVSVHFLRHRRWILLSAFGLAVTIGSSFLRVLLPSQATLQPLVAPLPQDSAIQVFFNQSEANVYTEPYRQITRHGDNLEQVLIDSIMEATKTVDVAVQELNLPHVAQALLESQQRGVQVRLILENQYSHSEGDRLRALQIIRQGQIPQLDDTADGSKGSGLMHHKFVVIDGKTVVTGSANLTYSGIHGDADDLQSRGNANVLLKIDSEAIAQQFTQEFNVMWGDGPGGKTDSQFGLQKPLRPAQSLTLPTSRVSLQFSPVSASRPWAQSANGLIGQTIGQATRSIDAALFVFSDQPIANQLETQVRAGVQFRALIDPGFAYRPYSEALDILGIAIPNQRCNIEADNRLWAAPIQSIGTPALAYGDKLHHKFAVIDDKTVIVGSQNWSHAANAENDETLLVIRNETVAAHFNREFERLYSDAYLGETPLLARKIEDGKQRCP
ncbi:MAG: phosphatidylserine/phosphatidylglycerophosphate/cardiolipin synthase family protein [Phormidesmis sp.]